MASNRNLHSSGPSSPLPAQLGELMTIAVGLAGIILLLATIYILFIY